MMFGLTWLQLLLYIGIPAVVVIVALIVIIVVAVKRSKKKNAVGQPESAPATQEAAAEAAEPVEEEAAEPARAEAAEEPAEEPAEEVEEEPAEEVAEESSQEQPEDGEAPAEAKTEKAKPANKTYHISKRNKTDGRWQVRIGGGQKAIKTFATQLEAIDYAKKLAENQEAKIVIHKEDGSFRRLTYHKKK